MGQKPKRANSTEPGIVSDETTTTDSVGEQHVRPEPISSTEGVRTYTVKAGDTPASIARRFYGNPDKFKPIMDANRDRLANGLREGDLLLIPPEDSFAG